MPTYFFSAPGRTEISGNHTDHQHGCVLAAAVNLETVAEVLMQVVDSGIYSVSELCAFLDWLIEYQGRSRTRNMKPAVTKWQADREFIRNYRIGSRQQVGINGIRYKTDW